MSDVKTIGLDFDGPVHAYSRGYQDGSIYDSASPGAFRAIKRLQQSHAVFIFTSRDNLGAVATWLTRRGGFECILDDGTDTFWGDQDKLLVTNRKLPAVAYIDDRGVHWVTWVQALTDLEVRGLVPYEDGSWTP